MTHTLYFGREYVHVVVDAVRAATSEILVCMYEWGWYQGHRAGTAQDINRALCQAAQRGLSVNVLLHNEPPRRPLYAINRHTASRLQRHGVAVRFALSSRVCHAKFFVIDSHTLILGSHNISQRATTANLEVGLLLNSPPDALRLRDFFFSHYNRSPASST